MNYYNRGGILASIPQITKIILVANILVFFVDVFTGGQVVKAFMAVWSIHTGNFQPYQLVTHMFAHGSFGHLFFNMFGVFIFGRAVEMRLGSKRFFILYFLSGLGAVGLQLLVYYLMADPGLMVGASGALFGIMVAFAVFFPNVEMIMIFLPIPIKAKYMVAGYAALELFSGITSLNGGSQIAHFAHLGGAIVGFILVKYWNRNQFRMF